MNNNSYLVENMPRNASWVPYDLIVVRTGVRLPIFDHLILLHAIHANGTQPMVYERDASKLTCPVCDHSWNISAWGKMQILQAASQAAGIFNYQEDGSGQVWSAVLVNGSQEIPKHGLYCLLIKED